MSISEGLSVEDWVSVIIVSYNSKAVIGGALESIDPAIRTIVVDNNSNDGTVDYIQQNFPYVEVISNQQNVGFGRANNIGLERVVTEFALILNPDAKLIEEDTFERLIEAAGRYPNAAIIAPAIVMESGAQQLTLAAPHAYRRAANAMKSFSMGDVMGDTCGYSLSGAVMLFRMSTFDGGQHFFDPNIFMYFEDDDICMSCRARGYSTLLIPSVSVLHLVGKSSAASLEIEALKMRHKTFSQLYVMSKHGERNRAINKARRMLWRSRIQLLLARLFLQRHRAVLSASRRLGAASFLRFVG